MKKLNELKVDDILYAIDKHSLAYILEFRVIEIEDDKLFVDTPYGLHSLKMNNSYTSNFIFINYDRLRESYYVSTDRDYLIKSYTNYLELSKNYYQNNILELNSHIKQNEDNLNRTLYDLEKIKNIK